jgi:Tyrosine phosphatase family
VAQVILPERMDAPGGRAARRRRLRRIALATSTVLLVLALGACWTFRRPWFRGNLGIVDAGLVIRSAQPTSRLTDRIRDYHLRSILNLRGGGPSDWWYVDEVKAARADSVSFYDFPISATKRPSRRDLLVLIDTLRSCPYPLLIHCKSGADRTGLASAIYLMVRRGIPPDQAEGAFTIEHGHFPVCGPEHLHEPLREYAAWLAAQGLAHSPDRFRDWVKNDYRSPDGLEDPPPLKPGPRQRHSG